MHCSLARLGFAFHKAAVSLLGDNQFFPVLNFREATTSEPRIVGTSFKAPMSG